MFSFFQTLFASVRGIFNLEMGKSSKTLKPSFDSQLLLLECCCFHWNIPVELRMIVRLYCHINIELSPGTTLSGCGGDFFSLIVSESEGRLYSGSWMTDSIKVWDIFTEQCIATLDSYYNAHTVWCLCISPQTHRLFSASSDCVVKIWDTVTFQDVDLLMGHTGYVMSLLVDEKANKLYSGSQDKTIIIWDLYSLTCVHTLPGHDGWVMNLCLSHTSNRLYSGSYDNIIKVWDTVSFECVHTICSHCSRGVPNFCLSEDGSRLYFVSYYNEDMVIRDTIKVWDTATNKCIATLEGHTKIVTSVCLSNKTNRLISASYDKTIEVWDLNTYTLIHTAETDDNKHLIYTWRLRHTL
jgi:WD40 repeat protein